MTNNIRLPLNEETIAGLRAGDRLLLTGTLYTARDASHKKLVAALDRGERLPFEINNQTIYYMGPSPARPGQTIGAAGPTTSGRMDAYTPRLLAAGLKGMIGKGERSATVKQAMIANRAVYLAATGGAGALLAAHIKRSDVVAYPELGAEAVYRLQVENFPAIVINDIYGGDLYETGKTKYRMNHPQ